MTTRLFPLVLTLVAAAMAATAADACCRRCRQQACWPSPQPGFRLYDITEAGNPAPADGWYVMVYVFSNQRTFYYGSYSYDDAQVAFRQLYNPNTQFAGVPQFITAGTKLKPYGG
jgi:hypothetical protein